MTRASWAAASSDEEARAYLQTRLTVLYKLMFWSIVALLGLLFVMYGAYPSIEPEYNNYVYAMFAGGLSTMAFVWRRLLLRRELTFEQLHAIDLFYTVGTNTCIAASAVISYDFRPAAACCLIYSCFTVLTRALIVPSTGLRTAVLTTLATIPLTAAAIVVVHLRDQEIPGPGFVVGYIQLGIVAILLSAAGSHIIYGLRQDVSAAQQLGQYTLVRRIGEGKGDVYLAHHIMLRRMTAVKLLRRARIGADALVRFQREVQQMSELTHPNTVAVYDYGYNPAGDFYYAMEFLGGGVDLETLVRDHGAQPAGRVIQILSQLCGALQEAHDRGFSHRNVKPLNIILCQRGEMPDVVKLLDFGLVTAETQVSGSADYFAPEAVPDPSTSGPAADLYALGAVGYFLLTGRGASDSPSKPPSAWTDLIAGPIPPALEAIILQCLREQPGDRQASATAIAEALGAVVSDGWDDELARAWWREIIPSEQAAAITQIAIKVDLVDREAA